MDARCRVARLAATSRQSAAQFNLALFQSHMDHVVVSNLRLNSTWHWYIRGRHIAIVSVDQSIGVVPETVWRVARGLYIGITEVQLPAHFFSSVSNSHLSSTLCGRITLLDDLFPFPSQAHKVPHPPA